METALCNTSQELREMEAAWLDLWRRTPQATPFQSPMWLLPWWEEFGSDELQVIAQRSGQDLQALAPLYVVRDEDESLGMLLGTGNSDYLDVLCAAGQADEIVNILTSLDCAAWDLQQLRPSSPLLAAAAPEGWQDEVSEHEVSVILPLDDDRTSTHFRKKLRYYGRSLERIAPLRFESAGPSTFDTFFDALLTLHAARWQRRGMPGMLADQPVQRFHRRAARAMLDAGVLRLYAMRHGDRIAAVFYGFSSHGVVYFYLSGYDPELEKFSPGTLTVAHAVEEARREGAHTFDFLRGAEQYKYEWGAADRPNMRRVLTRG